ncbi:family 20 glycosylhydrolase [Flexivirga alba]|uniref:beta-N-acetylhexosaminidase n=1 Tax=Flexivirga alba TaxID=702742 RepID=A0ABW2AET1_9MICO
MDDAEEAAVRIRLAGKAVLATLISASLTAVPSGPAGAVATTAPGGALGNPAPVVLPSLRTWEGGRGTWHRTPSTRIVLQPGQARDLRPAAQTFAQDLGTETGRTPAVVVGDARPGDIVLRLGTAGVPSSSQGYRIDIGASVQITARAGDGVFYGTQTVEQALKSNPSRATIPQGHGTDWPTISERGQMLDVGRKFFTVDQLKVQIRRMAWQKLNVFHIHFTDWEGFRIQVPQFPGLASAQSYSPADLRELQDYAKRYHVRIIPEVDLPGHATPITTYDPSLRFSCPSMDKANWPGGENGGWTLDITKPHTQQFVHDLIADIAPMFDDKVFHIGGDEVGLDPAKNACPELVKFTKDKGFQFPEDVFVDFQNSLDEQLRGMGKTTETWEWWNQYGQQSSIAPNKDIVMQDYVDADPTDFAEQGYRVVASPEPVLYVSAGFGQKLGEYGYVDIQNVYEHYPFATSQNLDAYEVARWADRAETQSVHFLDFFAERPLQVTAERTWGGPRSATVWQFLARADAIGDAPGTPLGDYTALANAGMTASADSEETSAESAPVKNAIDDNPYTIWHTAYTGGDAPLPHRITLDLHGSRDVAGLQYLPRQDGGVNGRIADYRIETSVDGTHWGAIATGTFDDDQTQKTVTFAPTKARYVRLTALSSTNGKPFSSAGEVTLLQRADPAGTARLAAARPAL